MEAKERPLAIGIMSLCQAPGSLFGLLGGLLAQHYSYPVVFGVALGLGVLGLLVILRPEPVRNIGGEVVVDA